MATAWSMTAREIVLDALSLLNVIGAGETPNGNDYALAVRTLNAVLKELPIHGYAWPNLNVADSAITWSGVTPSYVQAPTDYWSDLMLFRTDANGNKTLLTGLQRVAWQAIPNRSATGTYPTHFYEDVDGKVYLWPIPTQAPGLVSSYIQKPDDVVVSSPPDFPVAGALALQYGLAAHLALHFERDPAPFAAVWVSKRDLLIANAVNTAPITFDLLD